MSQWDKLLQRTYELDPDLRFDELKKIMEYYGYRLTVSKAGSSHAVFRKKGKCPVTIPKHKPIKKVYIEMVRHIVESEAEHNADN